MWSNIVRYASRQICQKLSPSLIVQHLNFGRWQARVIKANESTNEQDTSSFSSGVWISGATAWAGALGAAWAPGGSTSPATCCTWGGGIWGGGIWGGACIWGDGTPLVGVILSCLVSCFVLGADYMEKFQPGLTFQPGDWDMEKRRMIWTRNTKCGNQPSCHKHLA